MTDYGFKPITDPLSSDLVPKDQSIGLAKLCLLYGTRIIRETSNTGDVSTTMYTVPDGKVFMLFVINATANNTDASTVCSVHVCVPSTANLPAIAYVTAPPTVTGPSGNSISVNPAVPVRLVAGEKIVFFLNGQDTGEFDGSASIFGYEIDADIFNKLL